jgi:hypothetical protein
MHSSFRIISPPLGKFLPDFAERKNDTIFTQGTPHFGALFMTIFGALFNDH